MTLPALELHNPLHDFAIDEDTLVPQRRPDHAIAQIRLLVDQVLDPLSQDFINLRRARSSAIVGRASRYAQDSTDGDSREAFPSSESIERCSLSSKGIILNASLAISLSITS